MSDAFEYYLLIEENTPHTPDIVLTDEMDFMDIDLMDEDPQEHIQALESIQFRFGHQWPKKPDMVDYLSDGSMGVFSKQIIDAVISLNIKGVRWIPSTVYDPKNKNTYEDYYFLHILNFIDAMNEEKSDFSESPLGGVSSIDQLFLDKTKLSKVSLEKRLIFRLNELFTFVLYHKSVVDKILATTPRGFRFIKVEDYWPGSAFDSGDAAADAEFRVRSEKLRSEMKATEQRAKEKEAARKETLSEEATEFETAIEMMKRAVSGYKFADPYKIVTAEWDGEKVVRFVHHIFTRDFEFSSDHSGKGTNHYLVNYGLLHEIFKRKTALTEDDAIIFIEQFMSHFLLFDGSGNPMFIKQVVKQFPKEKSPTVAQALLRYKEALETAEIAFENVRAEKKPKTLELLNAYFQ